MWASTAGTLATVAPPPSSIPPTPPRCAELSSGGYRVPVLLHPLTLVPWADVIPPPYVQRPLCLTTHPPRLEVTFLREFLAGAKRRIEKKLPPKIGQKCPSGTFLGKICQKCNTFLAQIAKKEEFDLLDRGSRVPPPSREIFLTRCLTIGPLAGCLVGGHLFGQILMSNNPPPDRRTDITGHWMGGR